MERTAAFTFQDAMAQMARCPLGHRRRTDRLVDSTRRISLHPGGTLPEKLQDPAAYRATLRLMNHPAVTHRSILQPHIEATLERPGFYPAGGGRFRVTVAPTKALAPLELEQRGALRAQRVRAVVANLPRAIGERELHRFVARTHWDSSTVSLDAVPNSIGPGNALIAEVESEHVTEVFTGFGEKQVRAETVANMCADEVLSYLATDAPVGPHLADQLVLMLALAGEGTFRTTTPTKHTHTQLEIIPRFVETKMSCTEDAGGGTWRVVARRG